MTEITEFIGLVFGSWVVGYGMGLTLLWFKKIIEALP